MRPAIEIFFSYAHEDEALREELEKHLVLLKRQGIITAWHDRKIIPGQEFAGEINAHLNTAHIILLLVSPDFMASDYCYDIEVKRAMERHDSGEARVIPIILRPTYWQAAPFGKLQALPKDGRPVVDPGWYSMDNATHDEAFHNVAEGIRKACEELVNFFTSAADLRAQAIDSLSQHRQPDLTAFHFVSDIPLPPEPYLAHPYTLLQTSMLIGRQTELNLLTDWVANSQAELYPVHLLRIVAIGGMGKSALTWKWFRDTARLRMQPLAGQMWWSFYESDATFENFVVRALAYTTRQAKEDILRLPPIEREAQLLAVLDRKPYLIVLDGLERLLIAYTRMDAVYLADDDLDQQTANRIASAHGLPQSAGQSFIGQSRLRKTTDPRLGTFLRKLATVKSARILISTRLYPADLQTIVGNEMPGSKALFLEGLTDDDALALWHAFGVSGSRELMVPLFQRVDKLPLLIQLLAGKVAHDRRAPGDFDQWWKAHPDFNPFSLPLVQVKSHVLAFALQGLDEKVLQVLQTIAAFRIPATYDTLVALLVGSRKPCKDELMLSAVLSNLEDRGLLGWDRRANRYDLHPIVRGVVWNALVDQDKQQVYSTLRTYFEALPTTKLDTIAKLEDLTFAVELYSALIGLQQYEEAFTLYSDYLHGPLFYFGAYDQVCSLLEMFFPSGHETLPPLASIRHQSLVLNRLSLAFGRTGQLEREIGLLHRLIALLADGATEEPGSIGDHATDFQNLAQALLLSRSICEADYFVRCSLPEARHFVTLQQIMFGGAFYTGGSFEADCLDTFGLILAARGEIEKADKVYQVSRELRAEQKGPVFIHSDADLVAVWKNDPVELLSLRDLVWSISATAEQKAFNVLALRLGGMVALNEGDFEKAEEYLSAALAQTRTAHVVPEELQILLWLAEVRRRQEDFNVARELLEDLRNLAERGPYLLAQVDALNVLAQIERDAGNHATAVEAATMAYRLAWCDGPPFAFYWGLQAAKTHLSALNVPEPSLPPFDTSKYKPMPEVTGY